MRNTQPLLDGRTELILSPLLPLLESRTHPVNRAKLAARTAAGSVLGARFVQFSVCFLSSQTSAAVLCVCASFAPLCVCVVCVF